MIRLRKSIRRSARPAVLSVLGLLTAALLLAHSPAMASQHPAMEGVSADALGACLAILELAGSIALLAPAWRPQRFAGPRWRPPRDTFAHAVLLTFDQRLATPARAGPAALQVFRL